MFSRFLMVFISIFFYSISSYGWGARGHALICETAAYVVAKSEKKEFLMNYSYDFSYYCNVPDFIWKRPKTYKKEFINHFMNLEYFDEQVSPKGKGSEISPYLLSRKEFNKKFTTLSPTRGRAWWRVTELLDRIEVLTKSLKEKKIKRENRQKAQGEWLLTIGILGHYVGDLAMPLHLTKNYDGQETQQKGVHYFVESKMVNELYLEDGYSLQADVFNKAIKQWSTFKVRNKGKSDLELIQELSRVSQQKAKTVLDVDKTGGRSDIVKLKKSYKDLLVERLVQGVLYQAFFINKNLGWDFDSHNFYKFYERPTFIESDR